MVDDKTIISVTNRSRGSVGYKIPDMGNLKRKFEKGETKKVTAEELRKLDWSAGGHRLIKDFFKLDNKELIEELLNEVEPEYYYSEEQIKDLLLNGNMDAFMDCLDFAPEGVINLMKDLAISLEIPDTRKREAISKRTNSDVNNAIKINQLSKVEEDKKPEEEKKRRVQQPAEATEEAPRGRRTTPNEYNVVG